MVAFLETLTNMERISDHCSNVAVYVMGHEGNHMQAWIDTSTSG